PPALGNGRDPQRNLYWGAAYGVKTYFKASEDWGLAWSGRGAQDAILKRCVFKSSKNQSNQVGRNGFSFRGCRYRQTKTFTQDALRGGFDRPRRRPSDSATRRPSLRPIPEVRRSCSAEAVRDKVVKCEGGARRCRRPFTFGSIRRAGLPLRDDRCDVQPQPLRHSGSIRWIGLEEVLDLQLLNALRHAIAQAGDDVVHQPLLRVCRQQPE